MPELRVLLVDDNQAFIASLRDLLAGELSLTIVGTASSAQAGGLEARRLKPDVVLMDLVMPGAMTGLEGIRDIKALDGGLMVVALTLHDEPEYQEAAAQAGADAFVGKAHCALLLPPLLRAIARQRGLLPGSPANE